MHSAGALASWQVGSLAEAMAAEKAGCDFIIAQGIEAGGHIRGTLGLLPLGRVAALLPGTLGFVGFVLPGTLGLVGLVVTGFLLVCAERTESAATQVAMMPTYFIRFMRFLS